MLTTFDRALSMGFLASYKKSGWLWLSQLTVEYYCQDCLVATGELDDVTHVLRISPFNPGQPFMMQSGWIGITRMRDNGAVLYIPDLLPFALENRYFGQYNIRYDKNARQILIDLKERTKKYGK